MQCSRYSANFTRSSDNSTLLQYFSDLRFQIQKFSFYIFKSPQLLRQGRSNNNKQDYQALRVCVACLLLQVLFYLTANWLWNLKYFLLLRFLMKFFSFILILLFLLLIFLLVYISFVTFLFFDLALLISYFTIIFPIFFPLILFIFFLFIIWPVLILFILFLLLIFTPLSLLTFYLTRFHFFSDLLILLLLSYFGFTHLWCRFLLLILKILRWSQRLLRVLFFVYFFYFWSFFVSLIKLLCIELRLLLNLPCFLLLFLLNVNSTFLLNWLFWLFLFVLGDFWLIVLWNWIFRVDLLHWLVTF